METKKRFRLEPPEGGWGYLVCIGLALPFIQILGVLPSFGLIFGDFLDSIGAGTSAIAVITSSFFSALSFAGLFANALFKKYSIRAVAVSGGLLYFAGSIVQVFVGTTYHLLIAFSLMQGVASGLIIPALYTTFNSYFVEKRVMMMSLAQTLVGLGTMFYPVVIQKLYSWYGFRGCLLVLAALNGHAILGTLVMHPVEWHMRRIEITESKVQETVPEEAEKSEHATPLMGSRLGSKLSLSPARSYRSLSERMSRRASSIASLGNWTGAVVVSDVSERNPNSSGKWRAVVDFLDLTLLKKPVYVNIVLGISFALYSDVAFFTLQPMYLFKLEYSKADTASVIAIGACADLISRILLAFGAVFISVPSRHVYLAGAFFTVIARFAFLNVSGFVRMSIVTAIMGFLRTWIHVPLPLIFAEYLSPERFSSGYGLFMFLQGNIMFMIGPFVGYIRDRTQDYELTFHILNFFMAACAIPWLIEIIYVKCRRRNKIIEIPKIEMTCA